MSDINGPPSVGELINGIRGLYHKSKTSSQDMSCDMVDEKLSKQALAKEMSAIREAAVRCSKLTKESEEWARRRPFHEKMIAKSMEVPSTVCERRCSSLVKCRSNACSCQRLESVSSRSLKKVESAEISSSGRIPQVLNAPRKLIKHSIGETVLQLEKRIILHVYPDSEKIYYGPLEDLREVITSEPDKNLRAKLLQALDCRIQRLQPLGWDMQHHVTFGNRLMQRYGVGAPAWFYDEPDPLVTHAQLARIVSKRLPLDERLNMMTILSCLLSLALEDGRPLFLTCRGEEFQTMRNL